MGLCKKCYKRRRCYEADTIGRCSEYKRIDEIAAEVRSVETSGATISEAGSQEAVGDVKTGGRGVEGLLLCAEVQKTDAVD